MIGVDTNVWVRYLVEDDQDQTALAARVLESSEASEQGLYLAQVTLCETVWVLQSGYGFTKAEVVGVVRELLRVRHVTIEGSDRVRTALRVFERGSADFSDYLVLTDARELGCDGFVTFDQDLLTEPDAVHPADR